MHMVFHDDVSSGSLTENASPTTLQYGELDARKRRERKSRWEHHNGRGPPTENDAPAAQFVGYPIDRAGANGNVCRRFLEGKCKFGDGCRFAHTDGAGIQKASPGAKGNKGRGKGKQHPAKVKNFNKCGSLYVRASELKCAWPHQEPPEPPCIFLEVGNLKDNTVDFEAPKGFASLEILCDHYSVFGNPFVAGDSAETRWAWTDSLRDNACDAYAEFIDELLCPLATQYHECECLAQLLHSIKEKRADRGLDTFVCQSWQKTFGTWTLRDFRDSFKDLVRLVKKRRDAAYDPLGLQIGPDNMTRLVCHCAPRRCHLQALAKHIVKSMGEARAIGQEVVPETLLEFHEFMTRRESEAIAPCPAPISDPPPPTSLSPALWLEAGVQDRIREKAEGHAILGGQDAKGQSSYGAQAENIMIPLRRKTPSKSSQQRRVPRQPYGPPPWGDRWGAAGIVALRRESSGPSVCLVEKRNGRLGFPKGRAEHPDASPLQTAQREWCEESMLPVENLSISEEDPFVDGWGCHYFFAEWRYGEWTSDSTWDVLDDPLDPDPIVRAHWMSCQAALAHEMLSRERKEILRRACRIDGSVHNISNKLESGVSASRRWKNSAAT
jgi:8-oxo-dGTP pyrophosphatase MutT (NUDIX family)